MFEWSSSFGTRSLLAFNAMNAYFHVVAKLGQSEKYQRLFADLSESELKERFVRPYEKGAGFFSGNDLIDPRDLRSILIVRTGRAEQVERDDINRNDLDRIEKMNRSSSVVFISAGRGYDPEDIAQAGEDVTHSFIKGPPGFRAARFEPSIKVLGWIGGIIAAVVAAGIVKWLGWL